MNNISLVTNTHSSCRDLWEPYLKRIDKFFPQIESFVLSDVVNQQYANHQFIQYVNNDAYYLRWQPLKKMNCEYFIYMQEDFFLYDKVDIESIQRCIDFLNQNPLSFIRLIKSGNFDDIPLGNNLYLIPFNHVNLFSMQATIWRREDFIKIYDTVASVDWRELPIYREKMQDLGMGGAYIFNGEKKRGICHHDSQTFPYIATGIIQGKWNYKEYPKEINDLASEYNLDLSVRGLFS